MARKIPSALKSRNWSKSSADRNRCLSNAASASPNVRKSGKSGANFPYALRDTGLTKLNEDIVVPRSRLEDLFKFAARLQKRHGLPVACFGHAGDGNIHTNVMVDLNQPRAKQRAEARSR